MGGKASLDKGKRAERAVAGVLREIMGRVAAELNVANNTTISRNLMQSDQGGHDIVVPWCAIEVKHHETLCLPQWWAQCLTSAQRVKLEPVLIYKQNNVKFRVRLFTTMRVWDGTEVKVLSDIAWEDYLVYFARQCAAYFAYQVRQQGQRAAG